MVTTNYLDVLIKCPVCHKHYSRREQGKCPHNFIGKEGKMDKIEGVVSGKKIAKAQLAKDDGDC